MASSQIPTSGFESSNPNDNSLMSVFELTKKPLFSIPNQYIRTNHKSPAIHDLFDINKKPLTKRSIATIPTIDLKNLLMEETSDLELQKLHFTCQDWGIFQLVNHGVSSLLLEKLKNETEEFFKLPMDEKMKYGLKIGDVEGYGNINRTDDQKLDWSDRLFMITNPILRRKPHLFPKLPLSLRTTLESYFMELGRLAMTLLNFLLANALKLDKNTVVDINDMFEDGLQSVRMTYYPPCPQPEMVVGLTRHSDIDAITILNQLNGVDGLEIIKDGVWMPVKVPQHAFVVNVGDILEIMSNGIYKSVEHRAMANSMKERISVAMFFNPKFEAEIGPLPSLINPKNPPLFKRIGMEDYINDFIARRKLDGKSFLEKMKIQNEDINK